MTHSEKEGHVVTKEKLLALIGRWEFQLVFLLIVAGIASAALSPYFLNVRSLLGMTTHFIEIGIMALPMAFVIITGAIDLSVASNLAMSAIVMASAFKAGLSMGAAVVVGLLVGALGGLINGVLIGKAKLPSLVVTLGTYALYRGLGYSILGDQSAKGFPDWFAFMGQSDVPGTAIPIQLVLFLGLAVIFGLLLHRTSFGRFTYALGQNEVASRFSGVPVGLVTVLIFTINGLMASVAGIVLTSRFGSVRPNIGLGLELDVITAVVLGGVDIFGGSGSMVGVVLSLFLLGTVQFGMDLINTRGQVQRIVVGGLLILAILLPELISRLEQGGRSAMAE